MTTTPHLTLVSETEVYDLSRRETASERVRRLQSNAKALAREQVLELAQAMESLAGMARDISLGGEAYPVGVRELCARMTEEMPVRARTIQALLSRD